MQNLFSHFTLKQTGCFGVSAIEMVTIQSPKEIHKFSTKLKTGKGQKKNQRNVNIQEEKKVVC